MGETGVGVNVRADVAAGGTGVAVEVKIEVGVTVGGTGVAVGV